MYFSSYKNHKLKIKKTIMSWSSRNKNEVIFCTIYFVQRKCFYHLCFISMYSVLNTFLRIYLILHIKKFTSYTFFLVFKIVESSQCILKSCFFLSVIFPQGLLKMKTRRKNRHSFQLFLKRARVTLK